MSLLDVLFLFLVFLFPILFKSIQEKQRIEQAKGKMKPKNTTSQVGKIETFPKERKSLYEEKYKTKEESLLPEYEYRTFERDTENVDLNSGFLAEEISSMEKVKTKSSFNKLSKDDLVKGIVLKEILSEPKCMKYM